MRKGHGRRSLGGFHVRVSSISRVTNGFLLTYFGAEVYTIYQHRPFSGFSGVGLKYGATGTQSHAAARVLFSFL